MSVMCAIICFRGLVHFRKWNLMHFMSSPGVPVPKPIFHPMWSSILFIFYRDFLFAPTIHISQLWRGAVVVVFLLLQNFQWFERRPFFVWIYICRRYFHYFRIKDANITMHKKWFPPNNATGCEMSVYVLACPGEREGMEWSQRRVLTHKKRQYH